MEKSEFLNFKVFKKNERAFVQNLRVDVCRNDLKIDLISNFETSFDDAVLDTIVDLAELGNFEVAPDAHEMAYLFDLKIEVDSFAASC